MNDQDYIKLKFLGDKIKNLRNERNISQEKLAEITGLDRTYISGLERGLRNPSYLVLQRIAKELNIKEACFFEN